MVFIWQGIFLFKIENGIRCRKKAEAGKQCSI
jgi:hypothetical protein